LVVLPVELLLEPLFELLSVLFLEFEKLPDLYPLDEEAELDLLDELLEVELLLLGVELFVLLEVELLKLPDLKPEEVDRGAA
jgi:hypothetical protein